jgi:hypothetical protein
MSGGVNSVVSICWDRSGLKLNKPEAVTESNRNEIQDMDDLAHLLEVYRDLNSIFDRYQLPLRAIGVLRKMANRCSPKSLCTGNAIALIVDALEKEKFSGEDKKVVDSFLAEMRMIRDKYLILFGPEAQHISPEVKDRYIKIEGAEAGPLHKRALTALRTVIEELGVKLKIDNRGNWIDDLSIEKINSMVRQKCGQGFVIEGQKPPISPVQKPNILPTPPLPVSKEVSPWNWGIRLRSGYGDSVSGPNDTELIQVRGANLAGGGTLDYKIDGNKRFQLNFDTMSANDFGRDDFTFDDNFLGASIVGKSYFAQLGLRHYKSDRPTVIRPNQDMAVESAGIKLLLKEGIYFDSAETFRIGVANYTQPSNSHLQLNVLGTAGLTFKFGRYAFSPFAIGGVIFDKGEKQAIDGGGLNANLDLNAFGLGLNAYAINYPKKQSNIGFQLEGSIKLTKNTNLLITLGPCEYASGNGQTAVNFQGGLGFVYGSAGTGPKPLLFEPLPYLMRSSAWE